MALGIAMGIAKMGMGALNYFRGQAASQQAMRDAARFGQQISNTKFINKFAALQAPTRGAQIQMDAISRQAQASTEAAAEGGLRGAIGATGRTVQGVTDAGGKIAAALDKLQLQIDNKFLTEEQRIDLLNKRKDLQLAYQRLSGAQGAGTAGQQMMMGGIAQGLGGLGDLTAGIIEDSDLYRKKDGIGDEDELELTDTSIEKLYSPPDTSKLLAEDAMGDVEKLKPIKQGEGPSFEFPSTATAVTPKDYSGATQQFHSQNKVGTVGWNPMGSAHSAQFIPQPNLSSSLSGAAGQTSGSAGLSGNVLDEDMFALVPNRRVWDPILGTYVTK